MRDLIVRPVSGVTAAISTSPNRKIMLFGGLTAARVKSEPLRALPVKQAASMVQVNGHDSTIQPESAATARRSLLRTTTIRRFGKSHWARGRLRRLQELPVFHPGCGVIETTSTGVTTMRFAGSASPPEK